MKKRTLELWGEHGLSVFQYLLALFMMFAGIATAIGPITPLDGELGWLYSSRYHLVFYGTTFFVAGFTLFWGKIRKPRKWTGRGLLWIYLSFVFATLMNLLAWGFGMPGAWVGNLLASIIVGALYLRWRFKTEYIDPKHFTRDIEELR